MTLCQQCGFEPVKRARAIYCSKSCATAAKWQIHGERMRQGVTRGKARQQQQYYARVEARMRRELAPLVDRVPMADLLRVVVRIYGKAYSLGYHVGINRSKRNAMRKDVAA